MQVGVREEEIDIQRMKEGERRVRSLLVVSLLLREDPDAEVSILVGLEGGGYQDVLARWQLEAVEHLPQVDEGVRPLPCSVGQEELFVEVEVGLSCQLREKQRQEGVRVTGGSQPGPSCHSNRGQK